MKDGSFGEGRDQDNLPTRWKKDNYMLFFPSIKAKKLVIIWCSALHRRETIAFSLYREAKNGWSSLGAESEDQWFPDLLAMWLDSLLSVLSLLIYKRGCKTGPNSEHSTVRIKASC